MDERTYNVRLFNETARTAAIVLKRLCPEAREAYLLESSPEMAAAIRRELEAPSKSWSTPPEPK